MIAGLGGLYSEALFVLKYHPRDRFAGHLLLSGFVVTRGREYLALAHNMELVIVSVIIILFIACVWC